MPGSLERYDSFHRADKMISVTPSTTIHHEERQCVGFDYDVQLAPRLS